MNENSIIHHELISNFLSTIITHLQKEPESVDRNLLSKSLSTLFNAILNMNTTYSLTIATTPSLLQDILSIVLLLQTRGTELIEENYLKLIDASMSIHLAKLLGGSLDHLFVTTPELLQTIENGCIHNPSWRRRLFFVSLLTTLQVHGADVAISPAFISALLREENIIVVKASIRLLYLNSNPLRIALQDLSQDHLNQLLVRLVKGGNITRNDLKTKAQNSYSSDVVAILDLHVCNATSDLLMDCPSVTQHRINNYGRYMIAILRVGKGMRNRKNE